MDNNNNNNDHADFGTASVDACDLWFSEYHTPSVRLSFEVEVLETVQTPYQKLSFMRNPTFGIFFTLNGFAQMTSKDEFIYHDMIVHPAMAVNPGIRRVLIIGGGDGGTAREVSRYPGVEKIDLVEIDGEVIRLSRKYLPSTAGVFENEPRLNVIIGDGIDWVKNSPDASYDLILVDSTDPVGPGEGLFTTEFYHHCYRILSDDGIMINQQEGAFYSQDTWEMKRAHHKVSSVFPISYIYGFNMPTYASGYWYFGFASKKLDPIIDLHSSEWLALGLNTRYYNPDLHLGAFALPNYVLKALEND